MLAIFEHGDVVKINFDPSLRHEPAGWHYAVVISPFRMNYLAALTLVAPITSRDNGFPLHIPIGEDERNPVFGFVQVEGLRSVDLASRSNAGALEHVGSLDDDTMQRVMGAVGLFTGLSEG